jgi:hypothetical protein
MKRLLETHGARALTLVGMICAAAGISALGGCRTGESIAVSSAYGPGIKFSGLGPTYAWAANSSRPRLGPPEVHQILRTSVADRLAAKGFASAPDASASFLIDYDVARSERNDASMSAHGEVIEEGSIILEVSDVTTRQLIWRGVARARILDSDSPEVREKRINAALDSLMKSFPHKA